MGSVNTGFCNQLWRFTGFFFLAAENNCSYVLIENLFWKDTHGTNQFVPHDFFFNVERWNTFHQDLPAFVSFDPELDIDIYTLPSTNITILTAKNASYTYGYRPNVKYKKVNWKNATKPIPIAHVNPNQSINRFRQTMRSISNGQHPIPNENIYRSILSGALEPHQYIMEIITDILKILRNGEGFMTIHMRVEPDMLRQQHICNEKRVTSIRNITELIYNKYPEPPVDHILLPVAFDVMEKMEQNIVNKSNEFLTDIELLNRQNLADLKNLLTDGMYDGKVKVLLAGSKLIVDKANPYYRKYNVFTGSVLNYFISIESKIFVGTETSSWSSSISNARLFRGNLENYFFNPNGLNHVTPFNDTKPHRFIC
ncbi:hypothetical protein CTEN210_15953 [Chaetoceros tenuissimus]|uniref:O-fucosyltransferase family protein n=1 Tax=Chaetoceros tenuissimus TaxID=426638 RepID=A0AAD3HD54_9STRA|nr:hypothetical protein CTEN210_15953 [Chaetoceros tenuissimus]